MKEIQGTIYQCDHCTKQSLSEWEIKGHEKTCLETQEKYRKQQEEYHQKTNDARSKAMKLARDDTALSLLVKNGLMREARRRAIDLYDSEVYYDCNCSSWHEETYELMLKAALDQEIPEPDNCTCQGEMLVYNPFCPEHGTQEL
jgi:hypothetical protein